MFKYIIKPVNDLSKKKCHSRLAQFVIEKQKTKLYSVFAVFN